MDWLISNDHEHEVQRFFAKFKRVFGRDSSRERFYLGQNGEISRVSVNGNDENDLRQAESIQDENTLEQEQVDNRHHKSGASCESSDSSFENEPNLSDKMQRRKDKRSKKKRRKKKARASQTGA